MITAGNGDDELKTAPTGGQTDDKGQFFGTVLFCFFDKYFINLLCMIIHRVEKSGNFGTSRHNPVMAGRLIRCRIMRYMCMTGYYA